MYLYLSLNERAVPVNIGWFKDWALNADFSSLFEIPDIAGVKVSDVPRILYLALDRPRKRNFFIPRLFQSLIFRQCIYEDEMALLFKHKTDFGSYNFVSNGSIYMASCYPFFGYDMQLINELFRPVPAVREKIDKRCAAFTSHTIGVHVRRTDNVLSINESPIELFYKHIDADIKLFPDTNIYLATDSEEVKNCFRERYNSILITSDSEADRNSVAGIRDGMVDLYSLSRTSKIYGSFGSSFSELASDISGTLLCIVRR